MIHPLNEFFLIERSGENGIFVKQFIYDLRTFDTSSFVPFPIIHLSIRNQCKQRLFYLGFCNLNFFLIRFRPVILYLLNDTNREPQNDQNRRPISIDQL